MSVRFVKKSQSSYTASTPTSTFTVPEGFDGRIIFYDGYEVKKYYSINARDDRDILYYNNDGNVVSHGLRRDYANEAEKEDEKLHIK